MSFKLHLEFNYRQYQIEAVLALFDYFEQNATGHPLISAPGGSGKALIIVCFICEVLRRYPNQRILQLVHSKELVEQNSKKFRQIMPTGPSGVYCAGLNSRDTGQAVIFGSMASCGNNIDAFGHRDLIVLDEAHCLSPNEETTYRKIITRLTEINPNLRVVGLGASNYRLGQGCLTDNGFFTDICFDITTVDCFNRLIAEGFLSPLIPKRTSFELDISGVAISKGDLNSTQLQKAVDKHEITYSAIQESVQLGQDRYCWLVFASGIEHCEHIVEILQTFGISAAAIHSKITNDERDERIDAYKTGKLQCLVGFRVLTVGFDHPPIDFIIDLYPTVSPGMHVQKYSRGTRPYDHNDPRLYIPGFEYTKKNCLILDFSSNTRRLGPINDPVLPRKKGEKTGEAPIKICAAIHDGVTCGIYNHSTSRYCGGKPYPSDEGCGAEFEFKTKLLRTAGTDVILAGELNVPEIETKNVTRVIYNRHTKIGSQPSIKVSYYCGLQRYTEWVCPEAKGMAVTRARNWWMQRHALPLPATTDEALLYVSQLRVPKRIQVMKTGQYYEVKGVEWD